MNVAISAIRTKDIRINRSELVESIQELGHNVFYLGQASNDDLHPDYKKYNVPFLSIPIGRNNTNPLNEVRSIIKAKKVLKANNINALIVYGIRTFPTMVIAAKLAGVENILCIVNGSGQLFQLQGIKGLLIKTISYPMLLLSLLLCNNVLFQNPDDLNMLQKKRLLWKKNYGLINGSGVNIEEFYASNLNSKPVFLMVSRLTAKKGVNEYLQAAQQVKISYPEAEFQIVGPVEDSSIDIEKMQELANEGVIEIIGKTDNVKTFIENCRYFVLPSYYPEGIPRSILEAMSMGRPIITTDSSGCRETVTEGKNGFLVPPKNYKQLANKMIWMIENPQETEKMGIESRRICEEKFDVHKINNKMLACLRLIKN